MVCKCCGYVRQRWIVVLLACLGLTLAHVQRACINVVLASQTRRNHSYLECTHFRTSRKPRIKFLDDWSGIKDSHILTAFFVGYFVSQIPGGILAVLYGAKVILGGSILVSSLCSILIPAATGMDNLYLLLLRFLMGLSQGPIDSALAIMGVKWNPREERCLLKAVVYSGVPMGVFLANLFSSLVLHYGLSVDWIFYTSGVLGAVWLVFWQVFFFRTPMENPFISVEESRYIVRSVAYDCRSRRGTWNFHYLSATGHKRIKTIRNIPLKSIFTSWQILIVGLANFGYDFGFQMLSTMLPFYVATELQPPVIKMGLMTAAPFFCMVFGMLLYGSFCQLLVSQKIFRAVSLTKTMGIIGLPICGLCLVIASQVRCAAVLATILFSTAAFYGGATASGPWLTPSLLAPALAGMANAASNSLSGLPGVFVSLLPHYTFTQEGGTMAEWTTLFYCTTAVMCLTSLPYILFSQTNIQDWNST